MKYWFIIVLLLVSCRKGINIPTEGISSVKITLYPYSDDNKNSTGDTSVVTSRAAISEIVTALNRNHDEFLIFEDKYDVIIQYKDSSLVVGVRGSAINVRGRRCRTANNVERLVKKYFK